MSAGTTHPDAAWRWMDFLSRQGDPAQESPVPWLPARRSAAEASGFWETVDEELAAALRYAIEHSYTTGEGPGYEAFLGAIEAILEEEKPVEAALAEAQAQAQAEIQAEITAQVQATPVPTPHVAVPTDQQSDQQTITFIPAKGILDFRLYRIAAEQFGETHPNVIVQVEASPAYSPDYRQKLTQTADCFQHYPPDFLNPHSREDILSLGPFLDADPAVAAGDFYAPALEQFTWEGQLWGLPAEISVGVIEYNKELFDAASVDYPALDWTIDDFMTMATALTRGDGAGKQYGFVSDVFEWPEMELMIDLLGARLVDRSVDPPALSFNDPATVAAVRQYVSLSTEHGVKPIFVTHAPAAASESIVEERKALIEGGRAAMWTHAGLLSATERSEQPSTGVVPVPTRADGTSGPWGVVANGYFIRRGADAGVRQACWEWIVFLTERPELVQGFPARRSIAESEAYRQQIGAEWAAAYLASLASIAGADEPSIFVQEPWLSTARYWLIQAYDQAVQGEATVEEALDEAQRMADNYRACVIARDAFDVREEWYACVSEVDPANTLFSDPTEQE
jgi:ABC-type glycerol-3-phosphate transport system substrate-binding protein